MRRDDKPTRDAGSRSRTVDRAASRSPVLTRTFCQAPPRARARGRAGARRGTGGGRGRPAGGSSSERRDARGLSRRAAPLAVAPPRWRPFASRSTQATACERPRRAAVCVSPTRLGRGPRLSARRPTPAGAPITPTSLPPPALSAEQLLREPGDRAQGARPRSPPPLRALPSRDRGRWVAAEASRHALRPAPSPAERSLARSLARGPGAGPCESAPPSWA